MARAWRSTAYSPRDGRARRQRRLRRRRRRAAAKRRKANEKTNADALERRRLAPGDGDAFDGTRVNETATACDEFNRVCYDEIFLWIPRYKEAGFSTFRFEDFLDGRVRKLVPSVRRLVLRAAAPATLGVRWAEAAARLDAEERAGVGSAAELEEMYDAHAVKARGDGAFASGPLGGREVGPPRAQVGPGAARGGVRRRRRRRARRRRRVAQLSASVEQTVALACSMVGLAAAHPEWAKKLDAERVEVLTGSTPDAPIDPETIAKLRSTATFAARALRTAAASPARSA